MTKLSTKAISSKSSEMKATKTIKKGSRSGAKNVDYNDLIRKHDEILKEYKSRGELPSKSDLAKAFNLSTSVIANLRSKMVHREANPDKFNKQKYLEDLQATKRERDVRQIKEELKNKAEDCPICLVSLKDERRGNIHVTACDHYLHKSCMDRYTTELKKQGHPVTCPMCRKEQFTIRSKDKDEPESENDEPEYTVARVLGKRIIQNRLEFLIEWEGYSHRENSWQPFKNLKNCYEKIVEYEESCIEVVQL
jgi:hypothetical protein